MGTNVSQTCKIYRCSRFYISITIVTKWFDKKQDKNNSTVKTKNKGPKRLSDFDYSLYKNFKAR